MIEIMKAKQEDSLQIAIVNVYTWKTQYSGLMKDETINFRIKNVENSSEKIKKRINEDGNYLVAKKDNTVIGFCRYGKCQEKGYEDFGQINALYLLEGFKGKGIGKRLFEEAKKEIKNMGYSKMRIDCLKGNSTLGFYLHMGGKVVSEFEHTFVEEKIKEEIIEFEI